MKKKDVPELERTEHPLLSAIKFPYYVGKGIKSLLSREGGQEKVKVAREVKEHREEMTATYQEQPVLKKVSGDMTKWEHHFMQSDSQIGIILGARGTGKTALGVLFLENAYAKTKKQCYAMGFKQSEMPSWIEVVEQVDQIENDAIVLIDEGGILFSSRKSMSAPNKLLSDLILVARHKNLSIVFISQNSSNLDVNIIRQADFLALKPSSLLQIDFERKKIKDIYKEAHKDFEKLKDNRGLTYIYADKFRGFINSPLPSFWNQKISKSFK